MESPKTKNEMHYNEILKLVRRLRKNQTPAEIILWGELRNRKFKGNKFLMVSGVSTRHRV